MLANMTRLNGKGVDTRNGAAVLEYMKVTATEYYIGADGKEKSSSRWLGNGTAILGLKGNVSVEQMDMLAKGLAPDGTKLRQNGGDATRMGWDHTFCSGKPFSLAVAISNQLGKESLMEAHNAGVDVGMAYYGSIQQVRTGKAGMGEKLLTTGVVASGHTHWCSRSHDMSIHTHVLQYNVAQGADGKWRALDTEAQKDHIKTAGALARVQEAWELKQKGFGIIKDKELDADGRETGNIFYKIAGIKDELCDKFSKRRDEIIEHQVTNGGTKQEANLATRQDKDEPGYDELTKIWSQSLGDLRIEQPGLVPDSIESLIGLKSELGPEVNDHDILKQLHKHESSFTMAHVIERVASENVGRMDAKGALAEAQAFMLRNQIVELEPPKRGRLDAGEQRFAAQWMIDMELRIKERAEKRVDDQSVRLDPKVVERNIQRSEQEQGFVFTPNQRQAVTFQTCETGGTCVIEGRAGAGKTSISKPVVDSFRESGFQVFGVSTSWDAALKLQASAQIESFSVEKLLYDLDNGQRKLTNRDVLVFDEAGMAGTEAIDRIQGHVDAVGGKLILQGDARQIPPVVAGNPFVSMKESVGSVEITAIMRQKKMPDLQTAYLMYSDADHLGKRFMSRLERNNQVFGFETRKEAIAVLAQHYVDNPREDKDKLVQGGTNAEVKLLNQAIRSERFLAGKLGLEEARFDAKAGGKWQELALSTGDRVRFSARDKALGVVNGLYGVVEGLEKGREEDSWRLAIRTQSDAPELDGKRVEFDTADFCSLTYGYAGTVHKSQGQSIPDVYQLASPSMTDKNLQLVAFTRMKENFRLYGSHDDLAQMGVKISQERPKLNAIDQLPKPKVEIVAPVGDPAKVLGRQMGAVVREHQMQLKGKALRR